MTSLEQLLVFYGLAIVFGLPLTWLAFCVPGCHRQMVVVQAWATRQAVTNPAAARAALNVRTAIQIDPVLELTAAVFGHVAKQMPDERAAWKRANQILGAIVGETMSEKRIEELLRVVDYEAGRLSGHPEAVWEAIVGTAMSVAGLHDTPTAAGNRAIIDLLRDAWGYSHTEAVRFLSTFMQRWSEHNN